MTKRLKIQHQRLAAKEAEFQTLLMVCLRDCARGRYGLFGQNDYLDPEERYWSWPEAKRLRELCREIQALRLESGQPNEICDRFLRLCSLRGSNVPGEPNLAAEFLANLGQD